MGNMYTSYCNADQGIYYYTTYGNHQITAVDMHKEELDGNAWCGIRWFRGNRFIIKMGNDNVIFLNKEQLKNYFPVYFQYYAV